LRHGGIDRKKPRRDESDHQSQDVSPVHESRYRNEMKSLCALEPPDARALEKNVKARAIETNSRGFPQV
jgi:hypothetical protein